MIGFALPWLLLALLGLPWLYFLLRATPPLARRVRFPAFALLRGLATQERTPARMPVWLLLLRLLAMGVLIIGLAGPELLPMRGLSALAGRGPVLVVIDNGFAAAVDFSAIKQAARRVIGAAGRSGVVLLATAPDRSGHSVQASGVLTPRAAMAALGVLRVEPWPDDDRAALVALRRIDRLGPMPAVYLSDGLAGPGRAALLRALAPRLVLSDRARQVRLLRRARLGPQGGLHLRLDVVRQPRLVQAAVLAETQRKRVLARVTVRVAAGQRHGSAVIRLPAALLDRVARLVLARDGGSVPRQAGAVLLLDGAARRVAVGIIGNARADQRFTGADYYVRRAIPSADPVQIGPFQRVLAARPGVVILPDQTLDAARVTRLQRFLLHGGVVIRFAGPLSARETGGLTPDRLIAGVRHLGGVLGAGTPGRIGGFAAHSPLAGLSMAGDVSVSTARLVNPTRLDPGRVWARLGDGTPIVLGQRRGRGTLVYVLTSANTAWSTLVLAAEFPDLIRRLLRLGVGVRPRHGVVSLRRALDGQGALVKAGTAARPARIASLAQAMVSPVTPPGIWGNRQGRLAVNIGDHVPMLRAGHLPPDVRVLPLTGLPSARRFGPGLIALGLALLLLDWLVTLGLRGLLRGAGWLAVLMVGWAAMPRAHAALALVPKATLRTGAALRTELAYIPSGDARRDRTTRRGLLALSRLVRAQTAARLGAPRAVVPGVDQLDLYPVIYWLITATTAPPDRRACRALDGFMASGGLLVIDSDGGGAATSGSGAGFDPGARAAMRQAVACLAIPPLVRLTAQATLGHSFYIVRHYPGRFVGAPVWIAAKAGQDADGMSPVVIGQNDWATAWALGRDGTPLHALLPDAPGQRTEAERFGVNLVIYALTGTYKSDQAQLPLLLRRLAPEPAR